VSGLAGPPVMSFLKLSRDITHFDVGVYPATSYVPRLGTGYREESLGDFPQILQEEFGSEFQRFNTTIAKACPLLDTILGKYHPHSNSTTYLPQGQSSYHYCLTTVRSSKWPFSTRISCYNALYIWISYPSYMSSQSQFHYITSSLNSSLRNIYHSALPSSPLIQNIFLGTKTEDEPWFIY